MLLGGLCHPQEDCVINERTLSSTREDSDALGTTLLSLGGLCHPGEDTGS